MRLSIDAVAVQFISAGPDEHVLDFGTEAARLDGIRYLARRPTNIHASHQGVIGLTTQKQWSC